MVKIEVELSNVKAREVTYFLRARYGLPKAKLVNLIRMAVLTECAAQAKDESDAAYKKLNSKN